MPETWWCLKTGRVLLVGTAQTTRRQVIDDWERRWPTRTPWKEYRKRNPDLDIVKIRVEEVDDG